ncbi:DNA glycosylase [Chytriomyces sp. MP71]|nr:DNA glycosylase [Chytriomyces sp. MP71]
MWTFLAKQCELRLATTLFNGQSFTWVQTGPWHYTNVIEGRIVTLRQVDDGPVHFQIGRTIGATESNAEAGSSVVLGALREYFQLDVDVRELFAQWRRDDPKVFGERVPVGSPLEGVRLLRQPPVECLVSFICSANNNIARISQMVQTLKREYGECVGKLDLTTCDWIQPVQPSPAPPTAPATPSTPTRTRKSDAPAFAENIDPYATTLSSFTFHAFPTISALTAIPAPELEEALRARAFGYRGAYIAKTAHLLASHPPTWLATLRAPETPYLVAREALLSLHGVGPKVADCVALMGLDKFSAVPVDTHVWRIAKRDYGVGGKAKSLNAKVHTEIGDAFRKVFGERAGWAQSVLFSAEIGSGEKADAAAERALLVSANVSPEKWSASMSPEKRQLQLDEIKMDEVLGSVLVSADAACLDNKAEVMVVAFHLDTLETSTEVTSKKRKQ